MMDDKIPLRFSPSILPEEHYKFVTQKTFLINGSRVGRVYGAVGAMPAPSAPYARPTQLLSRPPPIQKLGAENHMLQLSI